MVEPVAIWNDLPCGCYFEELRGSWIFNTVCAEHFDGPGWVGGPAYEYGPVSQPFTMPYKYEEEASWNAESAALV